MKQAKIDRQSSRAKLLLLVPAFLAAACLGEMLSETLTVRVREFVIEDETIPHAFHGFRIAFLADIHHGPFFSRGRVADLVRRVNALEPDLVLLGGDYVHRGPQYVAPCFAELGKLEARCGGYGVLGNHDSWEGPAATLAAMRRNGIGTITPPVRFGAPAEIVLVTLK
jgi:predicted MPP superfamily phosphohydrolase